MTLLQKRAFLVAASLIVVLGIALRLIGANGELALDEVWSLKLLQSIGRPDQIFWKINHDNNHFLNSLWLYAIGPGASVLAQRALAIALGAAGIVVAGLWACERGPAACLVTMALFEGCFAMVQYGSEARGYSGLVLFAVAALVLCEKTLNGEDRRWWLALACLLGLLCHLNMVFLFVVIGIWVGFIQIRRQSDLMQAGWATIKLLYPAALCTSPLVLWVVYTLHSRVFTIGMLNPFAADRFTSAYGLLIRAMTGLPGLTAPAFYLLLPSNALALAWLWRRALNGRFSLYVIALVVLPALMFALRLPNTDQPRYFLVSGTAYLLLVGELMGIAFRHGATIRVAGVAVLLVFANQNAGFLQHFFIDGRGHYREAVQAMTTQGPARYGSNDAFRNPLLVDYYARQLGASATYIPDSEWCAAPPDWYLVYAFSHDAPPATVIAGPATCKQLFDAPSVFPYWGMSGFQWSLYRKAAR